MEKNHDITILNFIAQCNEFIEGKYLFANTKLEVLYKSLIDSPALVELFLQCSEDFKYSLEKTKAFVKLPTKLGTFTPPQDLDKFLALSFGVLKEIDEKVMNFNVFVPKYFSDDPKTPPTKRFANEVINPLKTIVAKYFELDAANKTHFKPEDITKMESEQELKEQEIQEEETVLQQQTQPSNQVLSEQFKNDEKEPKQISLEEIETNSHPIVDNKIIAQNREKAIKKLFDLAADCLQNMLEIIKGAAKLKEEIKIDAVFVLSRGLKALKNEKMEDFYSEVISLKYMQKALRIVRHEIKKLLDIIDAFEAI